ncbi:hypothetical protein ACFYTS_30590 [Nocardia sp. NPDC004151]|uniref:hypothetical protein n=1 Tax=Nocardia sp. NPDC004151 TaxID=3364304 RepID=UPI003681EC0F
MAGDSSLSDRRVLSAEEARWQTAVRRATVIGPLPRPNRVSVSVAEEAAARLRVLFTSALGLLIATLLGVPRSVGHYSLKPLVPEICSLARQIVSQGIRP